jgi:hypothetical protein
MFLVAAVAEEAPQLWRVQPALDLTISRQLCVTDVLARGVHEGTLGPASASTDRRQTSLEHRTFVDNTAHEMT